MLVDQALVVPVELLLYLILRVASGHSLQHNSKIACSDTGFVHDSLVGLLSAFDNVDREPPQHCYKHRQPCLDITQLK